MTVSKQVTVLKDVIRQAAQRSVTLYFEPLVHVINAIHKLIHLMKDTRKEGRR
jgi:hypothetical protein